MVASPATSVEASAAERPHLAEVFRAHHDFVWRSARRLGCPPASVDDAVQEVFLIAARKLDAIEQPQVIRTWLLRTTINVVRNSRRSEVRRESRHTEAGDLARCYSPDPSEHFAAADELLKVLECLDEERRAVFVLAVLEQMTAPEIAETLGVKINTVYSRLRSARKRLEGAIAKRRDP